jgi:hypothetical protein
MIKKDLKIWWDSPFKFPFAFGGKNRENNIVGTRTTTCRVVESGKGWFCAAEMDFACKKVNVPLTHYWEMYRY